MAGALRAKALEETREITVGGVDGYIDFRPPAGRAWWFKALRYALELKDAYVVDSGTYHNPSTLSVQRAGLTTINVKSWVTAGDPFVRAVLTESGEITTGGALTATNGEYLRIAWRMGLLTTPGTDHGSGKWSLAWIGVEADLV